MASNLALDSANWLFDDDAVVVVVFGAVGVGVDDVVVVSVLMSHWTKVTWASMEP